MAQSLSLPVTPPISPEDVLSKNEVESFYHAMELVQEMCVRRADHVMKSANPSNRAEEYLELADLRKAAEQAADLYFKAISQAENLIAEELSHHSDVYVREIGLALLRWEYSGLVI